MAYSTDEVRKVADRTNLPFGYLARLVSAEDPDPQDPEGNTTLAKQLTIVFDHHVAKCFASPDPVAALRSAGFTEVADALAARLPA